LYIAGYFRTNLFETLEKSLKQISTRVLVIVDHGQFEAHEKPNAENALVSAFRGGLVDIYVCTFDELRAFAEVAYPAALQALDTTGFLIEMACSGSLPMITIVRGDFPAARTNAYLLRNGDVVEFEIRKDIAGFENQPGERSRFTAGLLQKLLEPSRENVPDRLTPEAESQLADTILSDAINEAIKSWQQNPLREDETFVTR
jgi:hypothetical protein